MTRAFVTCVRSLLEYASSIWSPYLLKHINRTESVQKRFTKRLSSVSHLGCTDQLQPIGLEPLEQISMKFGLQMQTLNSRFVT